jgi:uncharacterized protein (DUF1697 family)
MTYVALLRGINVGGNKKVEMPRLRATFERLGFGDVRTYINSGNVVFTATESERGRLVHAIEDAIEEDFGMPIKVLVRDREALEKTANAIPDDWVTDSTMRCDVLFLSDDDHRPSIVDELPIKEGIDQAIYVDGAVIWHVDAANINRSGRTRIIGGRLYQASTVRNANTVRKLVSMMGETPSPR